MRIFGWLADHAGCGWYRLVLPLGALNDSQMATCWWNGAMRAPDWEADVVVAQRTFNPGPTAAIQRIVRSKGDRPLVVFELDDDLLNLDPSNPASAVYNRPDVRENITANIQAADLVTVSTEPLAEAVRKMNPRVVVLPNCIPSGMLTWHRGGYADRFTVGWQGSPTHAADWAPATRAVARWFKDSIEKVAPLRLEMHSLGALPDTFPKVPNHRHSPWDPNIARYYTGIDWDIALAPLQATVFNRSKSDIRVLEAAMLGIPAVASDVPAYSGSIEHGKTGFLVKNPRDWKAALDALLDVNTHAVMADAAWKWAGTRTVEEHAARWLEAYEKARSGSVV